MSTSPHDPLSPLPPSSRLRLARTLFKRRAPVGGPIEASFRLARIELDHVRRYNAAFGFPGSAIPLTYLYLLAQRAQLATMLARPLPFRIPGLIHVDNALAIHGEIRPEAPLVLHTTVGLPPPAGNGALLCVLATRAFDGEQLVFSCDSTYLVKRGARTPRHSPAPAPVPGSELGSWTLEADAGRRYAALSGDWNPIHLWRWSARLMGLRAPIIHGMHTVAMACAHWQRISGKPAAALACRFKRPVPLGARVTLSGAAGPSRLTAVCNGRPAVECTIGMHSSASLV